MLSVVSLLFGWICRRNKGRLLWPRGCCTYWLSYNWDRHVGVIAAESGTGWLSLMHAFVSSLNFFWEGCAIFWCFVRYLLFLDTWVLITATYLMFVKLHPCCWGWWRVLYVQQKLCGLMTLILVGMMIFLSWWMHMAGVQRRSKLGILIAVLTVFHPSQLLCGSTAGLGCRRLEEGEGPAPQGLQEWSSRNKNWTKWRMKLRDWE